MLTSLAYPASGGVNTTTTPALFDQRLAGTFVQLAGNLRIKDGRFRTRHRVVEAKITGDAVDQWRADHTQAAMWYAPQKGQGVHYIGVGPERLIESAAGRLYSLTPSGHDYIVTDITGDMRGRSDMPIAHLCQGENYVVRTDGVSPTVIFDGKKTFGSAGYNQFAKDAARFPNQAGPVIYAGGRFWVVLFGRRIYASDALHQTNQVDASDLLKFTDQTYDFQNVYFAPPADHGDILGLCVTINSGFDNSRAQGEVLAVCEGPALWGVQLGLSRSTWATSNMRKTRSVETAAAGQFAFAVRDGDILMRTPRGIESLNLLARERSTLGNVALDLSAEMRGILGYDDERLLTFASLINPLRWDRMFCTCAPVMIGNRHYHLGWVTANWNPMSERVPRSFGWEGVQMLPKEIGRVIQFVTFRQDGGSRILALVDKNEGVSKGLVEITRDDGVDILADGTTKEIEWYLLTRRLSTAGPYNTSSFQDLHLFLDDIRGEVKVTVFKRTDKNREWVEVREITVNAVEQNGERSISPQMTDGSFMLGQPFADDQGIRWGQLLIKGSGVASIDLAMNATAGAIASASVDAECALVENDPACQFDPFYPAK